MAGRNRSIQQIRFINGSECIANILVWDDDIIEMNNALVMEPLESDIDDHKSYYLLKPLMSYSDDLTKAITVNPGAVMCVSDPSPTVIEQYEGSLREIHNQIDDGDDSTSGTNVVSLDSRKRILTED
jgi:hypothetical protein